MEIDYKNIGLRIRKERSNQKLNQATLAEFADLTPTHISHIECGRTKLSLISLVKIANVLNLSVDYILSGTKNTNTSMQISNLLDLYDDCSSSELNAFYEINKITKVQFRNKDNN